MPRAMPNNMDLSTSVGQLSAYGPFVQRGSDNTVYLWEYKGGKQDNKNPETLGRPDLTILSNDANSLARWINETKLKER